MIRYQCKLPMPVAPRSLQLATNTRAILIKLHVDTGYLEVRPMAIGVSAYETMLMLKTLSKSGGTCYQEPSATIAPCLCTPGLSRQSERYTPSSDLCSIKTYKNSVINAPTSGPLLQNIFTLSRAQVESAQTGALSKTGLHCDLYTEVMTYNYLVALAMKHHLCLNHAGLDVRAKLSRGTQFYCTSNYG